MIRSIKDLFNDINGRRGGGSISIPRGSYNSALTKSVSQSYIGVEFYGGPSTGSGEVRYIKIAFENQGGLRSWNLYRNSGMGLDRMKNTYSFLDKNDKDIKEYLKQIDVSSLFKELFRGAQLQMVAKMPVYAAVMSRFAIIEDTSIGSLYVTFNPIMLSYEVHYNPKFIVEAMLKHALAVEFRRYKNLYDELTGYTALMFSHEMEHVLRANLGAGGVGSTALKGVEGELANLVSDSAINQSLSKIYMKYLPSVGIVNDIHSTFLIPGEIVNRGDQKLMELLAKSASKSFKGVQSSKGGSSRSQVIIKDRVGRLTIHIDDDLLEYYNDNSNELTKDISKFIKGISGTLSIDELGEMIAGAIEDLKKAQESSTSGIKMGSPLPSIGASGDGTSSGGSGEGPSPEESTGGGSEGEIGNKPKSIDSMSDSEKSLAKEALNKIIDGASVPSLSSDEKKKVEELQKKVNHDATKRVMSSADLSIVQKVNTGSTVGTWKSKFNKLLSQCLGIKEVYSNEVPSARIEGAFGREEEVPDLKTIVLAIDCSGSMGPDKFKKVLKEVETAGKALGSNSIEVKVVYWGSSCHFYKTKGTKGLISKIESNSKGLGGTDFNKACDFMIKKTPRFDALLVLTDGEFNSGSDTKSKAFISKNKRKVIWVLTPGGSTRDIATYDSTFSQRLIKQK